MKSVYLYEVGIKLWEQVESLLDSEYATLTIVRRDIVDLAGIWVDIVAAISMSLPNVIKWRSLGHPMEGARLVELKLLKQLEDSLEDGDVFKRDEVSGIYSYVKKVTEPVSELDLDSVAQSRYTALLFMADELVGLNEVWNIFQGADAGVNARFFASVISELDEIIICRVVGSDTHAVAQFIGKHKLVDMLLGPLASLSFEKISDGEVLALINRSS